MAFQRSPSSADRSFEALSRTLGQGLPRRRALALLAATLASGALGTAAYSAATAAKQKSRRHRAKAKRRKRYGMTSTMLVLDRGDFDIWDDDDGACRDERTGAEIPCAE